MPRTPDLRGGLSPGPSPFPAAGPLTTGPPAAEVSARATDERWAGCRTHACAPIHASAVEIGDRTARTTARGAFSSASGCRARGRAEP